MGFMYTDIVFGPFNPLRYRLRPIRRVRRSSRRR